MRKQLILLVDDEPDILDFIEYNLVKEGYDVRTAENGKDGVALAKKLTPDLILLDMMIEALWLFWRHRKAGLNGPPPLLLHLVSGALLLVAMKQAIADMPALFIAATMGVAGLAHIADLRSASNT